MASCLFGALVNAQKLLGLTKDCDCPTMFASTSIATAIPYLVMFILILSDNTACVCLQVAMAAQVLAPCLLLPPATPARPLAQPYLIAPGSDSDQ